MVKNQSLQYFIDKLKPHLEYPDLMEACFTEEGVAKLEVAGKEGWIIQKDPNLSYQFWSGFNTIMANSKMGRYDEFERPIVSGELPGGWRWQGFVSKYYVADGFDITIRKPGQCYSLMDFGVDGPLKDKIIQKIKRGARVLISGGTSSGKSSLTNWLLSKYCKHLRVQSVEDAHELVIPHKHQSRYFIDRNAKGEAPVGYKEIVEHMSRSRPDLIIVGEVSVENTVTVMRLFNEGKPAIATVHANSPDRAIGRGGALETNLLIGGYGQGSAQSIIEKFYEDIDVLIQVNSVGKTRRKKVTHVVFPNEGKTYTLNLDEEISNERALDEFDQLIAKDKSWTFAQTNVNQV